MTMITRIERVRMEADADKTPLWLIGMTDLVTLLLAFFILMFSTTEPRNKSWQTASQSMRDTFGHEDAVHRDLAGQTPQKNAEKTWQSLEKNPGLDLEYLNSLVKAQLASDPVLADMRIWKDQEGVVLSLGTDLGFEVGKADLSRQGYAVLKALVPFFNRLPNSLEVTGYTDATPVSGEGEYYSNWHLSLARANSAAAALAELGYDEPVVIRGRGTSDQNLLPTGFSSAMRRDMARRVDLRLHMVQP